MASWTLALRLPKDVLNDVILHLSARASRDVTFDAPFDPRSCQRCPTQARRPFTSSATAASIA